MVVMISGIAWVGRGVAKAVPDKVELDQETLKELIEGEEVPESTDMDDDNEEDEKNDKQTKTTGLRGSEVDKDNDEEVDMDEYEKNYDAPEEPMGNKSNSMKGVAVFANNANDPYMKNRDSEEEEEEKEDFEIKPTDNLVVVAKIEEEAWTLDVHIYNEVNDDWYVHHDYILEAPPMCVETINYDPGNNENTHSGNLLAVGTMDSKINIWDLDVVNSVVPVVTLGKEKKKKGKANLQQHSDAVLCLNWNSKTKHILASGGVDKTIILWDLDKAMAAQVIKSFDTELQTLRWHPVETTVMVAGTLSGQVKVVDCRNVEASFPASWNLGGQVEKVIWDHYNPYCIIAATDDGYLSYLDTRNTSAPLWKVFAHEGGCDDVALAPKNARCLVSVGSDEQMAVWKLNDDSTLTKVHGEIFSLGKLHSVAFCPDSDSILAVGGTKEDLVRIVDLTKRFTVSLDDPPETRWNAVIKAHKQYIPAVAAESRAYVPKWAQPFVFWFAGLLVHLFPDDYGAELRGIAKAAGLPLGEVVGLNILYDITAFDRHHIFGLGCTSLVAEDEKGTIWHGRNLDYEMGDLLKNITVVVDFVRGNRIVYSGVTFVLYNGLLTGQRPNAFSLSLNARYAGAYIDNVIMELYTHFRNPVSFVMRQVLEEETQYAWAVDRLIRTPLICPAYITVAGVKSGEGTIISRKRMGAANVWKLNPLKGHWFLVETNFDHWTPQGDRRKKVATHALNKLGRERLSAETLYNRVLSRRPVLNDLTIFSLVMSAAQPDVFHKYIAVRSNSTSMPSFSEYIL
ncbi:unnamed protein product, partial [Mesorhabditis belari]|uniref:Uncharacterized protein n=1 Tax=Mesorhabditis belari TaxID=2138241 RepID=A0AAF3E8H3_9BILA